MDVFKFCSLMKPCICVSTADASLPGKERDAILVFRPTTPMTINDFLNISISINNTV